LALARLAAFWFVLEAFFREESLFASCPDEFSAAVYTPECLVLEFHRSSPQRALEVLSGA
jgi:hypothetical protein